MKKLLSLFVVAFFALQTANVFAWGTTGHRVVAELAERNLSKKAKKQLKEIIGNQQLAYWANWPDFLKSDPSWKFADSWHYINMPGDLDRQAFDKELANSTDENLYKRALILIEELKDKSLPLAKKQENLYFLIHIIGDAHQPLHIGRPEDLGGNRVKIEWFRKATNLHSLWDSALVDFDKYSYTEYATVLDVHGANYNQKITSGTLEDWIYDSYTMANKLYASVEPEESLSYRYHFDHKDNVESQLLKGGLRLAKILNDIFK
ncbi:S1/P1 nuclease [Myroides odoratimimus]|uniref:S1/P1 nuclease n=1 Tax=Myroides odoratimimus TaxID=76832 RepID=UPI002574906E|nr:S1/P1 nuclease [Myroides odoratimimus]MDM1527941.1 S1/P1 nuclease [Myroides odoratimimus]